MISISFRSGNQFHFNELHSRSMPFVADWVTRNNRTYTAVFREG